MSEPTNHFDPPQSSVIPVQEPDGDLFKAAGIFLLKCIIFSVVFWLTWVFAIRPLTNSMSASSTQSSQAQEDQSNALMDKYWEQVREAEKLQGEYKRQSAETTKLLEKQDQLLNRFEAVIKRWEDQAPNRK